MLPPDKLYRYRCFNAYTDSELFDGEVHLNTPDKFNDPYDTFFEGYLNAFINETGMNKHNDGKDIDITEGILINEDGRIEKADEAFKKTLKGWHNNFHIACFSEKLDSLPMWAHYANNHTGYVIEYNTSKMPEYILQNFYHMIYIEDSKKFLNDNIRNIKGLIPYSLLKSKEWEYEYEWRYVELGHNVSETLQLKEYITNIYLGINCTLSNNKMLEYYEKLAEKNIILNKMLMNYSNFSIKWDDCREFIERIKKKKTK